MSGLGQQAVAVERREAGGVFAPRSAVDAEREDLHVEVEAANWAAIEQFERSSHGTSAGAVRCMYWTRTGQRLPRVQTKRELFHHRIVMEYDNWMGNVRGLGDETRDDRHSAALLFMKWLAERGDKETLPEITVADIDAHIQSRNVGLQDCYRGTEQYSPLSNLKQPKLRY